MDRDTFKTIRNDIRTPMITKSIDYKAYRYLKDNKIESFNGDECYIVLDIKSYLVKVIEGGGKDTYICDCQGSETYAYCSHSFAVLLHRYYKGYIEFDEVQQYCYRVWNIQVQFERATIYAKNKMGY